MKAKRNFGSLRAAADAGVVTPRIPSEAQAGFYARRAKLGGPLLVARIFPYQEVSKRTGELVGDEKLICEWNGRTFDAWSEGFRVDYWFLFANRPISQEEFRYGVGHQKWKASRPEPETPGEQTPTDWRTSAPPKFKAKKSKRRKKDDDGTNFRV